MKKKALSVLLALALVLGLFPALTLHIHAEDHTCVDSDDNQCCDTCGYCMGEHNFDPPYYHADESGHYPECQNCPYGYPEEKSAHTYTRYGCDDAEGHYLICDICSYGDQTTIVPHTYDGGSDYICDICSYNRCPEHNSVWDKENRDDTFHRIVCEICGAADGWMDHSDGDDDGRCDVCDTCMNGSHRYADWGEENRDNEMHRLVCSDCGLAFDWEDHYDQSDDGLCDVCGYEIHQHTYTEKKYHIDSGYHYALCDTCEYRDEANSGPHADGDSDCACDVCGYSMHQIDDMKDLGNGTHEGPCTACGETVAQPHAYDDIKWDETGHWDVCICGAVDADREKAAHVYESNNWYIDRERHYPECDGCGYHQPEGAAHVVPEGSEECTICGHTIHNYVWDQETWDHEDHWVVCGTCGVEDWEDHADSDDNDKLCDACGYNMACSHDYVETKYDAGGHWEVCTACEQVIYSPRLHSFDDQCYYVASEVHYPQCDSCEYYLETEGKPHADGDADKYCDDCGYEIHEHTYEEGRWHSEGGAHYPICDTCEYYDAAQGADCTDEDGDACCDVCGNCKNGVHDYAWDEETRGDAEHLMVCSVCGDEIWEDHSDHDEDGFCDVCGTCMDGLHTYVWNGENRDPADHLMECSVCSIEDWMNHTDDKDSNGLCDVCGTCMEHEDADYAWDGKTWDHEDHWFACKDCGVGYGWEDHADSDDADQLCDTCGFNMACFHGRTGVQHNETSHWSLCEACGQNVFSPSPHSFEYQTYHGDHDKHYPGCDSCEYYREDEGEAHVDADHNEKCDVCGWLIHGPTFKEGIWHSEDGVHYPECDYCVYYDAARGEACADWNGNHVCDVCSELMEDLCTDTDGNHVCDGGGCLRRMTELCKDADYDHVCDTAACQRHMKEFCGSRGDGRLCDLCGKNFCSHGYMENYVSHGDGTHTGYCVYCEETVTVDCENWGTDYDESHHWEYCRCGYRFSEGKHTYERGYWEERSVAGHTAECDVCGHEKWEAHTVQNGACTVCELQVTAYNDVYVGGVGLKSGQYLDNSGNITTTKPAGGYAYYKNGVLELNDYVYDGPGFLWKEEDDGETDWAALYATKDLTLVLKGENSLQITPSADEERDGIGVGAEKNLTIRGDGSLAVNADRKGFYVVGSLTITGGAVDVTAGYSAINADDDLTISGGTVSVNVEGYGLDSYGSVIISGGHVDIVTEMWDGIWADENVVISGGSVDIVTEDYSGIWADENVVISGGRVDITAGAEGIYTNEDVTVSGGTITIGAGARGVYAYNGSATISGGGITVDADSDGICASGDLEVSGGDLAVTSRSSAALTAEGGRLLLTGGNLELNAETFFAVVLAGEGITVGGQLPGGVKIEYDEPYYYIGDERAESSALTLLTPFSAELKDGSIQLTGAPWGLKVLFVTYDADGRMADIQVAEPSGGTVAVPDMEGEVTAFFLSIRGLPMCADLPIG